MKRLVYLGYYAKKLNRPLFDKFLQYTHEKYGLSKLKLYFNILSDSLKYNISLLEYFQFGFYKKNHDEKLPWAGTGHMYEYQLRMNPVSERDIVDDKRKFDKA